MTKTESQETVELPTEAVESVIDWLETGMSHGETAHSHETLRPTTVAMAQAHKHAYKSLIEAHPDYELTDGESE